MSDGFEDRFGGPELDPAWVPHYLPHWTTPERSAARYDLGPGGLVLRIDADQPAWRDDEGGLRVSNLQSGTSAAAQHPPRPAAAVVTPQPSRHRLAPSAGWAEAVIERPADPGCMSAFWLLGLQEDDERDAGELCVCELHGDRTTANVGVKAHADPRLEDDMAVVEVPAPGELHAFGVEWDAGGARFFLDGELVRACATAPAYPLLLLVDLFELEPPAVRDPAAYPRTARVPLVRWAPARPSAQGQP